MKKLIYRFSQNKNKLHKLSRKYIYFSGEASKKQKPWNSFVAKKLEYAENPKEVLVSHGLCWKQGAFLRRYWYLYKQIVIQ